MSNLHKDDKNNGSALVESILILGLLSVFMGGIPMLGSLIDLKQTTIQASRYSAWEKTVAVELDHLGSQVEQRFFKNQSTLLSSSSIGNQPGNVLWGEDQLHNNGEVTIAGISVDAESGGLASSGMTVYDDVSNIITKFGRAVGTGGWEVGNPIAKGLVTSTVGAELMDGEYFSDGRRIKESTAIYIDGWAAGDDSIVRERVQGFMPTSKLEALGKFVSKLQFLPMFGDLKNLKSSFGCVKTNIVTPKEYAPVGDVAALTVYQENPGDQC